MTCLEKWKQDHPGWTDEDIKALVDNKCPNTHYGIDIPDPVYCDGDKSCARCWNREIPVIKDSGERREFGTGAVRGIQEGKGRCDLMPLDVVGEYYHKAFGNDDSTWKTICPIAKFTETGDSHWLDLALIAFVDESDFDTHSEMFLEVAKHFEDGAKKYGENNWQKGIPVRCYIDSAVRHYLKWLRGDKDEPHDRAFCWNILCAIWTCKHKPELNDYRKENTNAEN